MNYKVFLYTFFCSSIYASVYCVSLPGILENLQEEIVYIARNRDLNDDQAHSALIDTVELARMRAEQFYHVSEHFYNDFHGLLTQQIAALQKTKLTKLDNAKYAVVAVAVSGLSFFLLRCLLLERKEYLELRSYNWRNYPYYSHRYNSYDEEDYVHAVMSCACFGGLAGLGSLHWLKEALLGNQDHLAHERLERLKVVFFN